MTTRSLFATRFYEADLGDDALVEELEDAALGLKASFNASARGDADQPGH